MDCKFNKLNKLICTKNDAHIFFDKIKQSDMKNKHKYKYYIGHVKGDKVSITEGKLNSKQL